MDEADIMEVEPVPKQRYLDDLTGDELGAEQAETARALETEFLKDMDVYSKIPVAECLRVTGKKPIPHRWVDVCKKDGSHR